MGNLIRTLFSSCYLVYENQPDKQGVVFNQKVYRDNFGYHNVYGDASAFGGQGQGCQTSSNAQGSCAMNICPAPNADSVLDSHSGQLWNLLHQKKSEETKEGGKKRRKERRWKGGRKGGREGRKEPHIN